MEPKNIDCRVTKAGSFKTVDINELNACLEAINAQSSIEGFTMAEMVEATDRSGRWCRTKMAVLIKEGRAMCAGRVRREMIDGRTCRVPAYKLMSNGGQV